ncbi:4Fe-4S binding protein [Megasphaera sp. SW808]
MKGYRPAHCTDESLCIGCASCARICPDSIITIEKD